MAAYDEYVRQLETIRKRAQDGTDYWMARDLQVVLGYERWESFVDAIVRAMEGTESAEVAVDNHFRQTTKMVEIGSGARRATEDWFLSKYACYLIAMNADSSKQEVGYAQTYFAIQTHRQEQTDLLSAAERRRELRGRVKDANKGLNKAAQEAGVQRFAIFNDAGYKGLYGGLGVTQIKAKKGIGPKDDLLDCVNHTELAANYFRITQAQQKIAQQATPSESVATRTHFKVGSEVRATMERISGIVPENLPAEPSLKRLKKSGPKGLLDGEE